MRDSKELLDGKRHHNSLGFSVKDDSDDGSCPSDSPEFDEITTTATRDETDAEIVRRLNAEYSQREIGENLGLAQQTVSDRVTKMAERLKSEKWEK